MWVRTINIGLNTSVRTTALGASASVSNGVALNTILSAGSAAVAGSYTKADVPGFDFRNTAAAAATYLSGAVSPGNYSTVCSYRRNLRFWLSHTNQLLDRCRHSFHPGLLHQSTPANYSTIAAQASYYTSGTIGAFGIGDTFTVTGTTGAAFTFTSAVAGNDNADLLAEINDGGANQASLAASGVHSRLGYGC